MINITLETPSLDKNSLSCLFENIDLIRNNQSFINTRKKYRNIKIKGIFSAGLYVGGMEIPLGVLLDLWNNTNWHTDNKFYFNIVGSPLSGMNNCAWYNYDTKQIEFGRVERWHYLAPVAFRHVQKSKDYLFRQQQLAKWQNKNKRENSTFAQWSKNVDTNNIKYHECPKVAKTLTIFQLVELLKQR